MLKGTPVEMMGTVTMLGSVGDAGLVVVVMVCIVKPVAIVGKYRWVFLRSLEKAWVLWKSSV